MSKASPDRVPRNLVERLIDQGSSLSPQLRRDILALKEEAVRPLIATVEDEGLQMADSPSEGWAPIHAIELLSQLRAPEAIQPLIRVLLTIDWNTIIHDRVLSCLRPFGQAAVDPVLQALEGTGDGETRKSLCSVLAGLGVRDERIFPLLLEQFTEDMELGAAHLAEYGDPQALLHLQQALDDYVPVADDSPLTGQTLIELYAAIEELGGTLTESQREKYNRVNASREQSRRRFEPLSEGIGHTLSYKKLGRNEPCWCGSSKKYKKCHWAADRKI